MNWLEREFEKKEVRKAIFELRGDKAPGPDGLPMAFFQHLWEDMRGDLAFYEGISL